MASLLTNTASQGPSKKKKLINFFNFYFYLSRWTLRLNPNVLLVWHPFRCDMTMKTLHVTFDDRMWFFQMCIDAFYLRIVIRKSFYSKFRVVDKSLIWTWILYIHFVLLKSTLARAWLNKWKLVSPHLVTWNLLFLFFWFFAKIFFLNIGKHTKCPKESVKSK